MIKWFKKWLQNTEFDPSDGLNYWRERIFLHIVFVLLFSALPAYIAAVVITLKLSMYTILIADSFAYGLLLFVFFNRSLLLHYRILILVNITFILAVLLLIMLGSIGPGFAYFVGFNFLVAMLLGLKATIHSLVLTLLTIVFFSFCILNNWFPNTALHGYQAFAFFTASINVILISSISSVPLAILVQTLDKKIKHQNSLQKQLHENLQNLFYAKQKAEESDNLKSSFLANMSHEIRTPLNAIMGFSSLLKEQPEMAVEERNQFIDTINDSGDYLLNIIDNIMDISMIEAKQLKYFLLDVKIKPFLEELKELYNPKIKDTGLVKVVFDIEDALEGLVMYTDSHRLKQVFVNLINNALKFTTQGEVRIGYDVNNEYIQFFVRDTGRGISESKQESIFERFVKIQDDAKVNAAGTGLGLPISKGILDVLGGKIWLESAVNVGTTFYFTVPLKK